MAVGVLLGLAVPPLATLAKPLLVPTLLIPLTLALVRLDWSALFALRRRPLLLAMALLWLLGASPILVWALATPLGALGLPEALRQALILMAAASPIVSSVAIALILELDAALAMVVVVLATALVPFTLPALAQALLGMNPELGQGALMLRLSLLVGGAFLAAGFILLLAPARWIERHREALDGLAVVNLVIFGIAIMDGVTSFATARPGYVASALVAAFAFNLLLQAAGTAMFWRQGPRAALAMGFMSGNCNMGLVLVALQGRASFDITAFFALAQLPMYMLPALLGPIYRRILMSRKELHATL